MKLRSKELGDKNIVGENIVALRKMQGMSQKSLLTKLQVAGTDMSNTSLSQLEGQYRLARDYEVLAVAEALEVSLDEIYRRKKDEPADEK